MSTIAVNAITNAAGGNTAQINGMTPTAQSLQGFRNRIINGDMRIDQRNNGASVTITNTAAFTYTVDRWAGYGSVASRFSVQQNAGSVTPPAGFTNYLGATSLSAHSVGSSGQFHVSQPVEGFNVADLAWGTANAAPVTLSFWVRSSLTGTFGGSIRNANVSRSYPFSYTISAANTWEYKTVTIPGDTTGTWLTNNGVGVFLGFGLGVGSTLSSTAGSWAAGDFVSATGAVSVVGTNGATFFITGVQLEAGSVATPFERRPFGTELALCQRYFESFSASSNPGGIYALGWANSGTNTRHCIQYAVEKRSGPTVTFSAASTFNMQLIANVAVSSFIAYTAGTKAAWIGVNYASTVITAGQACALIDSQTSPGTSFIQLSSEL